jgi:hypothetical protein
LVLVSPFGYRWAFGLSWILRRTHHEPSYRSGNIRFIAMLNARVDDDVADGDVEVAAAADGSSMSALASRAAQKRTSPDFA